MLMPFDTSFTVEEVGKNQIGGSEPEPMEYQLPLGFMGREYREGRKRFSWRDVVEELSETLPAYVCLLLLDSSPDSLRLSEALSQRYMDVDRVTGDDLVILSPVPVNVKVVVASTC